MDRQVRWMAGPERVLQHMASLSIRFCRVEYRGEQLTLKIAFVAIQWSNFVLVSNVIVLILYLFIYFCR